MKQKLEDIRQSAIETLQIKRKILVRQNKREYKTRGNTQHCQELWQEIQKIDLLIEDLKKA